MYNDFRNNPMIPTEQRKIYAQENKKPREQMPIVNLQLYQPSKPQQQQNKNNPNPAVFYPNYVPNPFNPAWYDNYMRMQYGYQPPVYKEYNINIGGVSGSHVSTAMMFEDAMPIKDVFSSIVTVGGRMDMYDYIRSVIFPRGDGDNVTRIDNDTNNSYYGPRGGSNNIVTSDTGKNLLSRLKLMDINPFNVNKLTNNPYKGLPFGFLLFRSCYPIRHDPKNAVAMCAQNSTGINVRIYRLTENAHLVKGSENIAHHDEWREIAFYNYIKDHIIKSKMCPHFVLMYGYNIVTNSGIIFDDLKSIQIPNNQNPVQQQLIRGNQQNLDKYQGTVLVCLTEAPNYNILKWASKDLRSDGNIVRTINSGYHSKHIWYSILFQLMCALYCMQLKKIIINNFRVDRHVFIKDINASGNVTNYWKYIINGIEYYVPNYGYTVMIDSNFRDFDDYSYLGKETDPLRPRKIDGMFMGNSQLTDEYAFNKCFEMFKTAVDPDNFNSSFIANGGVKPPEEVLFLLGQIKRDSNAPNRSTNISSYILRYMTMFLNNRVGTYLSSDEKNHVKVGGNKDFSPGQIVIWRDRNGNDRFAIHVSNIQPLSSQIITKEGDPNKSDFITINVSKSSLNGYSSTEQIKQDFKIDNANLNEESLLATYNM